MVKLLKKTPVSSSRGKTQAKKKKDLSPFVTTNSSNKQTIWLDSVATAVSDFILHWCTKYNKPQSGFVAPMKQAFLETNGELSDAWKVKAFMFRRDSTTEGNKYLPNREDSTYGWDVMISSRKENDTPASMGKNLAAEFTTFAATVPDFNTIPTFTFRHDLTTNPPRPLNYYLCDGDCLLLLKRVYAEDNEKNSILEDEDIMMSYFGSIELGQHILRSISDSSWSTVE